MNLERNNNEPVHGRRKKGCIEVICGSMFSGKTEELIRRLKRSQIANFKVEIFKPRTDKRYDEIQIVSHDRKSIPSTPVEWSSEILIFAAEADVIGIDEAQFFDDALPDVCNQLANQGKRVIVAGLDMDYKGQPFGPMPVLLSIAEFVTKVHAICLECGDLAHYSFRKVPSKELVLLGETESYIPLCRNCYLKKSQHAGI